MLEQCVPCKIIINGRVMATNAALLAETLGHQHAMYGAAMVLAAASRAMVQAFDESAAEGITKLPERPWGWKGCAQATQLIEWVSMVNHGATLPRGAVDLMRSWTLEANVRTAALVSGRVPS